MSAGHSSLAHRQGGSARGEALLHFFTPTPFLGELGHWLWPWPPEKPASLQGGLHSKHFISHGRPRAWGRGSGSACPHLTASPGQVAQASGHEWLLEGSPREKEDHLSGRRTCGCQPLPIHSFGKRPGAVGPRNKCLHGAPRQLWLHL